MDVENRSAAHVPCNVQTGGNNPCLQRGLLLTGLGCVLPRGAGPVPPLRWLKEEMRAREASIVLAELWPVQCEWWCDVFSSHQGTKLCAKPALVLHRGAVRELGSRREPVVTALCEGLVLAYWKQLFEVGLVTPGIQSIRRMVLVLFAV